MNEPLATHNPFSPAYDAYPTIRPSDGMRSSNHDRLAGTGRLLLRMPESSIVTISGGIAGAVAGVVSCPLDVIKTKLQAQGGFRSSRGAGSGGGAGLGSAAAALGTATYKGIKGTAVTIWNEEGVRGLYRGLGPMLLGYVPTWAVYLTVYNESQRYFNTKTDNKFLANMYSSLAGGTCSTLVTNPVWVVKTRLMSQSSPRGVPPEHYAARAPWYYRSTRDAFAKMYRAEGLRAFYSGLTPALLGLTHVAIQFPLYEVFKERLTGIPQGAAITPRDRRAHFWELSLSVFASKVVASTATYPHEVVRTRLQTQQRSWPSHAPENLGFRGSSAEQVAGDHRRRGAASSDGMINAPRYRGTVQTCRAMLREEGWRAFYAGLGTNLIRAVPSAMTTILTFEYMKKVLLAQRRAAEEALET